MKTLLIKTSLIAGLLLPLLVSADWQMVDDLENGLDKWTIGNRKSRPENPNFDSSWSVVPRPYDSQGGHALSAAEGSVRWNIVDVGMDLDPLPQTNNYTLYYEIAQSDLSCDRTIGLHPDTPDFWFTLNPDGTTYKENYGYAQYSTIHRMGFYGLNTRDATGTAYAANYSDGQLPEVWYKFWMVVYPGEFKWDLYTQGGEFAEITKVTSAVSDGYTWRNLTFDPLRTWRFRINGTRSDSVSTGAPSYVDNMYIDLTGVNLTQPPVSGGGGSKGPGIFGDYDLVDNHVDTGGWMSWVYVELYPYAYVYSLNTWIYSAGGSSSSGAWVYIFK